MSDAIDYTEVPYLQDILNFLPIDPDDEEDVIGYIDNISNLVAVNYKNGQYLFAYFGVHLLYMTYIYCTAWKIAQIEPKRYKDAIVFARSYSGREKDLKIEDADSIFSYSLIPEKEIAKLFRIIGLDKSQISIIGNLVEMRNEMAHASGKFEILTEEIFDAKVNNIISSMRNIHRCIVDFYNKTQIALQLKVCWYRKAGVNCSHCEKCYRTILEILLSGGDPNNFGFKVNEQTYKDIHEFLKYTIVNKGFWQPIQDKFIENSSCWRTQPDIAWILDIKLNSPMLYARKLLRKIKIIK